MANIPQVSLDTMSLIRVSLAGEGVVSRMLV